MCNTDSISHSTWVFLDPENNQAIDCHENKKLPCMPVLLSQRLVCDLQGRYYGDYYILIALMESSLQKKQTC